MADTIDLALKSEILFHRAPELGAALNMHKTSWWSLPYFVLTKTTFSGRWQLCSRTSIPSHPMSALRHNISVPKSCIHKVGTIFLSMLYFPKPQTVQNCSEKTHESKAKSDELFLPLLRCLSPTDAGNDLLPFADTVPCTGTAALHWQLGSYRICNGLGCHGSPESSLIWFKD